MPQAPAVRGTSVCFGPGGCDSMKRPSWLAPLQYHALEQPGQRPKEEASARNTRPSAGRQQGLWGWAPSPAEGRQKPAPEARPGPPLPEPSPKS